MASKQETKESSSVGWKADPIADELANRVKSLKWAMLQDTCPICQTVLLKNKSDKRLYCVSCKMNCCRPKDVKDGKVKLKKPVFRHAQPEQLPEQEEEGTGTPSEKLAKLPPFQKLQKELDEQRTQELGGEAAKEDGPSDEAEEPLPPQTDAKVEATMRKVNDVSAKMGEKLLAGWTMLAETCPKDGCDVPLMRAPGSDKTVCLACSSSPSPSGGGSTRKSPRPRSPVRARSPRSAARAPAGKQRPQHLLRTAIAAADDSDGDEVSAKLGEKMLQGWVLLSEHCPKCSCPLVKEKESGRTVCVQCASSPRGLPRRRPLSPAVDDGASLKRPCTQTRGGLEPVPEAEEKSLFRAQQHNHQHRRQRRPAVRPTTRELLGHDEDDELPRAPEQEPEEDRCKEPDHPAEPHPDEAAVVGEARREVARKLQHCTALLAGVTVDADSTQGPLQMERVSRLAGLIKDLAAALATLRMH